MSRGTDSVRHGRRWGEFVLVTFGFAFYRLYTSIFFVSNQVMPETQFTTEVVAYDIFGFLLAAFAAALAFVKRPAFFQSDVVTIVGASAMALGAVVYVALPPEVMPWIFALCTSFGVSFMTVQWGQALGVRWQEEGLFAIILGFFLAAALNTGVGFFTPLYVCLAVVSGPVSGLLLIILRRRRGVEAAKVDGREAAEGAGGLQDVGIIVRAATAFLLFAIASVFCSTPMEFSVIGGTDTPSLVLPLLRTCVTAVVCLIAFVLALMRRASLRSIYRLIPFFLVIGGLSVFLQGFSPLVAYVFALVGRLGFQLVFWLFAPRIACCSRLLPGRAFALEFSLYWLGYAGSLFMVRQLWPNPYLASVDAMGSMVVAAIVILLVAYLFILSEHDLRVATEDAQPDAADNEPGQAASASDQAASAPVSSDTALALLAERYELSPRETEVFYLLARGRDTAYIQKTLFISAGTVSSHRRRIYQKLGVHTKQELLDLVETGQLSQAGE